MKRRSIRIPNLGHAKAIILHRPHPTVQALTRQLTAIGLAVMLAWPELGPEALAVMQVEDFPAIVAIDSRGSNIYKSGPAAWASP